jgi:hypothetical protein
MRVTSIAFAGYRSFSARSPAAPDRPLENLRLAPLTILIGKNNSGKSTAARLPHHALLALGADGDDPFPMKGAGEIYGSRFRDIQHDGNFFNPVDIQIEFSSANHSDHVLTAQLVQLGELRGDGPPILERSTLDGVPSDAKRNRGLLPDTPEAEPLRREARELLRNSLHIGPFRQLIQPQYPVPSESVVEFSVVTDQMAQLLFSDSELRTAVGRWTTENLDGWRLDVRQSLDQFQLVARRDGREGNLADSGQGIQQVLPVATLCCGRKLGRGGAPFLDIVEQPELHLHDAAHAALGDLLLSAVAEGRGNIIVETHSESLVLRVRRRVAEGLSPKRVAIVYVEDNGDGSRLRRIALSPDGETDWWPEGVFSESFVEVKAIRLAQRARAETK